MVEFSPRYSEICPQGYPSQERTQWLVAPWGLDRKPLIVKSFNTTNFASMMIAEANGNKTTAKDEGREYTNEQNAMFNGFLTMAEVL